MIRVKKEVTDTMNQVIQNDYKYIKPFRDFVNKYAEENQMTTDQALEQDNVKIMWKRYTDL